MPAAATAIGEFGGMMPTAQGLPIATGSMSMTTIGASGAGATDGGEDFNDMAMTLFALAQICPLTSSSKDRSQGAVEWTAARRTGAFKIARRPSPARLWRR